MASAGWSRSVHFLEFADSLRTPSHWLLIGKEKNLDLDAVA